MYYVQYQRLKFTYMNKISYTFYLYIDDLVNLIKECLTLGLSHELVNKKELKMD